MIRTIRIELNDAQPRLIHREAPLRPVRIESPRQPVEIVQPFPLSVQGFLPRRVAAR